MKNKNRIKRKFVAAGHLCWFSRKYPNLTVNKVLELDPAYMVWVKDHLKYLRFATGLAKRINHARAELALKREAERSEFFRSWGC